MKTFWHVGPFGKAHAFMEGFVHNYRRHELFVELLEEIDRLEILLNDSEGSIEEKRLAKVMHQQLTEQFIDMITPANQDDKTRTGKNI